MVKVYAGVSSTVNFSYYYGEKLHVGKDAQDALPFQVNCLQKSHRIRGHFVERDLQHEFHSHFET